MGLLGSACGGSTYHPPESCLKAAPCGGDVLGTWSFLGACTNLSVANSDLQASCAGTSISALITAFSGLLTFNADLTYTTGTWHETFSAAESVPLTCANVPSCSSLSMTTRDPMSTVVTSCAGSGTCACHISGSINIAAESGTYGTYGTTLGMTGIQTSGSFEYCVEGDHLHLMQIGATSGAPLTDLVAERTTP